MKYLSIDLETTGLDPINDQILSFSGILEDTEKRKSFNECPQIDVVIVNERISGHPYALNMNAGIISSISTHISIRSWEEKIEYSRENRRIFLEKSSLPFYFYLWCLVYLEGKKDNSDLLDPIHWICERKKLSSTIGKVAEIMNKEGKITINVAGKNFATFDQKFLDEYPDFYKGIRIRKRILDPAILFVDWKNDNALPGLEDCKERCGMIRDVTHNSLEDAWDVIEVLRKKY